MEVWAAVCDQPEKPRVPSKYGARNRGTKRLNYCGRKPIRKHKPLPFPNDSPTKER